MSKNNLPKKQENIITFTTSVILNVVEQEVRFQKINEIIRRDLEKIIKQNHHDNLAFSAADTYRRGKNEVGA